MPLLHRKVDLQLLLVDFQCIFGDYILFVVINLFEFNGIIARRNYVFKNLLRGEIFQFLSCRSDWGHTIKHTLSRMVTH